METLQFTTEAAIQPVIALLSVVAVFLLGLRDAARDPATADQPATQYVPVIYSKVLSSWRHGESARGGRSGSSLRPGSLGRAPELPERPAPGWLMLSRGWTLLQTMVEGVEAMDRSRARTAAPQERPRAGPSPDDVRDGGVT